MSYEFLNIKIFENMKKINNGKIIVLQIINLLNKTNMKRYAVLIPVITILFMCSSCGTGTFYRSSTNFYLLQRGMTKQQFIEWSGMYDGEDYIGKRPASSKSFKYGNDVWEVWVFKVYRCGEYNCYVDHFEHVAFKNSKLEEWGTGELPITIRQNPNQFQYDINISNR
jgi:hypothetical protein